MAKFMTVIGASFCVVLSLFLVAGNALAQQPSFVLDSVK
jgi:hypothetical protein